MTSTDHDAAAREAVAYAIDLLHDGRSDVPPSGGYADVILAALSAAGFSISRTPEVGGIAISRYDAVTAVQCIRGIAKQHRDLGNYAQDQEAVAARIKQAIARAEGETA